MATITNLMALVLMQSLMNNEPLAFTDLLEEVEWMMKVLNNLGAKVFENDIKSSVERILVVHRKMMTLDRERRLRLVAEAAMSVSSETKNKMKGMYVSYFG